ncbi:hypothetical protein K435DRAFT_235884 [Dendrothele bispora CBS 962.96]|uniref:Uncharacterized protein n=1 Tax=Dendrothele bispora (strain CBS 962.96) TaxID=1314807 RepID=A0A4S8LPZ8_DENBC|nr:hypothetical protein K435DRAFT_235884 [Dendrothele bispora CBS 962.96]
MKLALSSWITFRINVRHDYSSLTDRDRVRFLWLDHCTGFFLQDTALAFCSRVFVNERSFAFSAPHSDTDHLVRSRCVGARNVGRRVELQLRTSPSVGIAYLSCPECD